MNTKNILLLTATVTPKSGVPNLKRVDPAIRLQDYKQALEFYLPLINQCCDAIVFAENSNSDIFPLRALVEQHGLSDQVEFIVFDGLDYPPSYDRGYGEFKLLDYAMEQSRLIRECTDKAIVWKITGRYIIKNICKIILSQPPNFGVYCNFRNYPKRWVDTYFMAYTPEAYETCFRDVYHRLKTNVPGITTGIAAEELFRSWLDQDLLRKQVRFVRRFKCTPDINGIRGADNQGYATDNRWKFYGRNILKSLFPWVWI